MRRVGRWWHFSVFICSIWQYVCVCVCGWMCVWYSYQYIIIGWHFWLYIAFCILFSFLVSKKEIIGRIYLVLLNMQKISNWILFNATWREGNGQCLYQFSCPNRTFRFSNTGSCARPFWGRQHERYACLCESLAVYFFPLRLWQKRWNNNEKFIQSHTRQAWREKRHRIKIEIQ